MKFQASITTALMSGIAAVLLGAALPAAAQDAEAAQALAKKSNCMKCHSISAKKEGPPFKETAAKYKGKPDGEAKLFAHLTTNPKVKVDGKEEEHENFKTKNEADIRNAIKWILAQ